MTTTATHLSRTAGRSSSPKPLAAYVRVSRKGDREDDRFRSPEIQRELIERWAEQRERKVVYFAPEIDVSGSRLSRPILDTIVQRIESGELGGVVVMRLDRLSRMTPAEVLGLFERIEAAGGVVYSTAEELDPATSSGRQNRMIQLAISRREWEDKRDGFARSKRNAIELGIPVAALAPFGYRRGEDRRYVVVPSEAKVVRRCFELRAEGRSRNEILAYFEKATGRKSSAQTIAYLLSNRVYLGELHYGQTDETRLSNLAAHKAIVELDLFEAVERVESSRKQPRAGSRGTRVALLAGLARCASCGSGLHRDRRSGRAPSGERYPWTYSCKARECDARARVPEDELDSYVVERVLQWAGPVADELVEVEREIGAVHSRIVLEAELDRAKESLAQWAENVEEERGLQARRALVERRAAELEAAGEASEVETARATIRSAFAGDVSVAGRRELLEVVLSGVLVARAPFGTEIAERVEPLFRDDEVPEQDHAEAAAEVAS